MRKAEKVVVSHIPDNINLSLKNVPTHPTDAMSRILIRSITEAFKDPVIVEDYKRWKKEWVKNNR